ncbi:MAG: rhodanese-like domain-containing protein [Gammaproteobacteria bacterium]|nr:rhodanese-like domain-containing protein [Gammaproteobacteria bacterium]MDQ7073611.1 rhodanese-like domain-containing protein [Gammaproteobacteria bacterium]
MNSSKRLCQQARQLLHKGATLLDVRDPNEYQAGALPNAVNLPLRSMPMALERLANNKAYVIYCGTGMRSARAREILQASGFNDVLDLGSYQTLQRC